MRTTQNSKTSALVQTVATALLVIITFYYAIQTRQTVKEMEKGRKLGLMPILTCEIKCDQMHSLNFVGEANNVIIRNIGNAPAVRTRLQIDLTNATKSTERFSSRDASIGIISLSQGIEPYTCVLAADPTRPKINDGQEPPQLMVVLRYQNAYQQSFRTVARFELEPSSQRCG